MANSEAIRTRRPDTETQLLQFEDVQACGEGRGVDVHWVPIAELVLSFSPRSAGEDSEHTRTLAESGAELPPIIVQRGTNRVIDGVHRVRAAQLRGEPTIKARFFDGDDQSAFVLAVRSNVRHGLPLSLADRKEAARRILCAHAAWSDRAIASVAGLSHKTVAALREKAGQPPGQTRIGRDGRRRPVSTASGRKLAKEILERDPNLSLREVSAAAGVSTGTVRDVRDRLRGQTGATVPSPEIAPPAQGSGPSRGKAVRRRRDRPADPEAILRTLRADPSLRFTQSGRVLLSILAVASMDTEEYERLIADLPDHCLGPVAELAAASVQAWQELATRFNQRRSMRD
ncbi:ParB/RepB/Spo0J family partition protein [Nocardia sp. NPDC051570]|uniref:ParB/RepB/Spo0J family partition protein n=1 Tax=Nocardia sp. NPDC051570 TaxID=3364324 RepID=UPI0037B37A44